MTLDQYLRQFIEGYLLEDLSSMASIVLGPGKKYGAVGYPMVMTTLSGIEVLGVLTSSAPFSEQNGAARFGDFWRQHLYPKNAARQRLDSAVYEFVRHGLAHQFMTKPMIRITKHRDPLHLTRDDDVVCLDALTLADEFATAYWTRVRPSIDADLAFKANMEARFLELRKANWQDHEAKQHLLAKFPHGSQPGSLATGGLSRINSPAVSGGFYSTNASTTDFGDPDK